MLMLMMMTMMLMMMMMIMMMVFAIDVDMRVQIVYLGCVTGWCDRIICLKGGKCNHFAILLLPFFVFTILFSKFIFTIVPFFCTLFAMLFSMWFLSYFSPSPAAF